MAVRLPDEFLNYAYYVHAVHDTYFGEDPSELHMPVIVFNVEEIYNNCANPNGYGTKIA